MIRKSKYGNRKVRVDNIQFDSEREAVRYSELKYLEMARKITDLELQKSFVLAPSVRYSTEPRAKPALRYVADFCYVEDGHPVVEDAKGYKHDAVYRIKKHLMLSVLGIEIREV
jgi:hypothetical protein